MECLSEISDLLAVYANRDKILSLACYSLKLAGSLQQKPSLLTASGQLAAARTSTRLLDDASMVKAIINYGLGKQDGPIWGTIGSISGLSSLVYLQADKLCFLLDTRILSVSKDLEYRIRVAHKVCWSVMSFLGFVRSLRALHTEGSSLQQPRPRKCAQARFTLATLTTTKLLCDVIHAVSWLPSGWLWGGKLRAEQASAVGTLSAVLALVMHYQGNKLLPSKQS